MYDVQHKGDVPVEAREGAIFETVKAIQLLRQGPSKSKQVYTIMTVLLLLTDKKSRYCQISNQLTSILNPQLLMSTLHQIVNFSIT